MFRSPLSFLRSTATRSALGGLLRPSAVARPPHSAASSAWSPPSSSGSRRLLNARSYGSSSSSSNGGRASGRSTPPPSRRSTGSPYQDDKDLPFLERRLPTRDTAKNFVRMWIMYVAAPVIVGLCVYSEWTREDRLEEMVYSPTRTYTTRFRLPTRSDAQNVREDSWQVVSRSETERILRRAERSTTVDDADGSIVKRIDTAAIAANAPIEDREADAIIPGPGGGSFFAVFDGHSGFRTSHFLSRTLLPSLALALGPPTAAGPAAESEALTGGGLKTSIASLGRSVGSLFGSSGAGSSVKPGTSGGGTAVERTVQTIQSTFEALDRSIVWDAADILSKSSGSSSLTAELRALGQAMLLPALSGSCALVAYLPPKQETLYVALAGDCRAVAGYWVPSPAGSVSDGSSGKSEGSWRLRVLTEDQTGRSAKEVARLRAEHPGEEQDVVRRGRVLGGLEPSRAFGDARYKWPREIQERLYEAFLTNDVEGKQPRPTPPLSKTPPYVTAKPEVTALPIAGADAAEGELRFVVLATDGLFDRLSNEAVVGLVGTFLASPDLRGAVPKADVLSRVLAPEAGAEGFDGKKETVKARKDDAAAEGGFIFGQDTNAATLLVRNSLAGADYKHMRELLSVKSPVTRFMRDDTTVKVVFFNERPAEREVYKKPKQWNDFLWRTDDEE